MRAPKKKRKEKKGDQAKQVIRKPEGFVDGGYCQKKGLKSNLFDVVVVVVVRSIGEVLEQRIFSLVRLISLHGSTLAKRQTGEAGRIGSSAGRKMEEIRHGGRKYRSL